MPQDGIDIRVLGVPDLEKKFKRLERRLQRKYLVRAFRSHLDRVRARIVVNLSGDPVEPRTGKLREAFSRARKRSASRRPRTLIRIGLVWPTREDLGIDAGETHFWPAALEYGHKGAPPHPYIRPAIDNYRRMDLRRIGRALRRELRRHEGAE